VEEKKNREPQKIHHTEHIKPTRPKTRSSNRKTTTAKQPPDKYAKAYFKQTKPDPPIRYLQPMECFFFLGVWMSGEYGFIAEADNGAVTKKGTPLPQPALPSPRTFPPLSHPPRASLHHQLLAAHTRDALGVEAPVAPPPHPKLLVPPVRLPRTASSPRKSGDPVDTQRTPAPD